MFYPKLNAKIAEACTNHFVESKYILQTTTPKVGDYPSFQLALAMHQHGYSTPTCTWYYLLQSESGIHLFLSTDTQVLWDTWIDTTPKYLELLDKRIYAPNEDELFYLGTQCLPKCFEGRDYEAEREKTREARRYLVELEKARADGNAMSHEISQREMSAYRTAYCTEQGLLLTWSASIRKEDGNFFASYFTSNNYGIPDAWYSCCTGAHESVINAFCELWVLFHENGAERLRNVKVKRGGSCTLHHYASAQAIVDGLLELHQAYLDSIKSKDKTGRIFSVEFSGDSGVGIDLSKRNLSKADVLGVLTNPKLDNSCFAEAYLDVTVNGGCIWQSSNFSKADLRIVSKYDGLLDFSGSTFDGASIEIITENSQMDFSSCAFRGAYLKDLGEKASNILFDGSDFANALLDADVFVCTSFNPRGAKNIIKYLVTPDTPVVAVRHCKEDKNYLMVRFKNLWHPFASHKRKFANVVEHSQSLQMLEAFLCHRVASPRYRRKETMNASNRGRLLRRCSAILQQCIAALRPKSK